MTKWFMPIHFVKAYNFFPVLLNIRADRSVAHVLDLRTVVLPVEHHLQECEGFSAARGHAGAKCRGSGL